MCYENEDYEEAEYTQHFQNGYKVYNRYGKVIDEFFA